MDFREEYENLEKIIKYANANNKYNITFKLSSVGEYLDAVHKENLTFGVRHEDGFPYSGNDRDYWTGFYTSRPTFKKQIRDFSAFMNAEQRLMSMQAMKGKFSKSNAAANDKMMQTLSVMLHHDAISGTEAQYVVYDYIRMMSEAIDGSRDTYKELLLEKLGKKFDKVYFCKTLSCNQTDVKGDFYLIAHNPASVVNQQMMRVKLSGKDYLSYHVSDGGFDLIQSDVLEQTRFTTEG